MIRRFLTSCFVGIGAVSLAGCFGAEFGEVMTPIAFGKAVDVAERIGGAGGFGGVMMDGYLEHVGPGMGFVTIEDLADPSGVIEVRFENEATEDATFHLSYFAAHFDLQDQLRDIVVPAGGQTSIEIPCAEIVGLGDLQRPGDMGCHLTDGWPIENTFAVPMFFGLDFVCGDTITFTLTPDTEDWDEDGIVDEFVLLSDGFVMHVDNGGPFGHSHMSGMMHPGFGGMMGFSRGGWTGSYGAQR